jgi:hypothetical protein
MKQKPAGHFWVIKYPESLTWDVCRLSCSKAHPSWLDAVLGSVMEEEFAEGLFLSPVIFTATYHLQFGVISMVEVVEGKQGSG